MKPRLAQLTMALIAGLSLISLYLVFLRNFLPVLERPLSLIDLVVFVTLVLRVVAMTLLPKLRSFPFLVKIIILSLEILIVLALSIAFSITSSREYFTLMSSVFYPWIGSTFFVVLPYFIFEFSRGLYRGDRLVTVLTSSSLLLADCIFAANLSFAGRSLPSGLSDLGRAALESVPHAPSVSVLGTLSNPLVVGAGIALYVTMLAYVSHSRKEFTSYSGKNTFALLLMLIGSAALLGWFFLLHGSTTNMLWILTVPSILFPVSLLVAFNERRE